MTHLGALWNDATLLEEAVTLAHRLAVLIEKDTQYDVVGGLAGFLLTLLNLYQVTQDAGILDLARACGE